MSIKNDIKSLKLFPKNLCDSMVNSFLFLLQKAIFTPRKINELWNIILKR